MKEKTKKNLKNVLERTGYVTNIEISEGEFHEDARNDKPAYVSYIVNLNSGKKETQLHRLEQEIRHGFFNGYYPCCSIHTCIEEISETEEKHTIYISPKHKTVQEKEKDVINAAIGLVKIIKNYHMKNQ